MIAAKNVSTSLKKDQEMCDFDHLACGDSDEELLCENNTKRRQHIDEVKTNRKICAPRQNLAK